MNKVKIEEKIESLFEDGFDNRQISVFQNEATLENLKTSNNEEHLDNFLSLIKLVFLYIPGAIMIHFVGMFSYFFIWFGLEFSDLFELSAGMIVGLIIGTFLVMFGIGKLKDLNYLKVPAMVFATSILISIIFAIVSAFTGMGMTGIYLLATFPITILLGYIIKRNIDKDQI